jgi:hypothetical protein
MPMQRWPTGMVTSKEKAAQFKLREWLDANVAKSNRVIMSRKTEVTMGAIFTWMSLVIFEFRDFGDVAIEYRHDR